MDDITTEKKLQLIQQIRSQHHRNQYDLSNREQILYGKTSTVADSIDTNYVIEDKGTSESLKIRGVLALMLCLFAIFFDLCGVEPMGIKMQEVFHVIATDYQAGMTDLVDAIYTNHILQP